MIITNGDSIIMYNFISSPSPSICGKSSKNVGNVTYLIYSLDEER